LLRRIILGRRGYCMGLFHTCPFNICYTDYDRVGALFFQHRNGFEKVVHGVFPLL